MCVYIYAYGQLCYYIIIHYYIYFNVLHLASCYTYDEMFYINALLSLCHRSHNVYLILDYIIMIFDFNDVFNVVLLFLMW